MMRADRRAGAIALGPAAFVLLSEGVDLAHASLGVVNGRLMSSSLRWG
jgi:hypothetical protein